VGGDYLDDGPLETMNDQPATKRDLKDLKRSILKHEIQAICCVVGIYVAYIIAWVVMWFMLSHLPKLPV
jgi:hypothetical protein